jgi:hypothetical protein
LTRTWKTLTLVVAVVGLVLATQGLAAGLSTVTNVYTVGVKTVPGIDTGLVLQNGQSVTVTATGTACPYGTLYCVGPDGNPAVDTTQSSYGGFVLPGAPAWGLVGRVGSGLWVQVGSGPTTLSGTGDLVFAMNDDWFSDNTGSFTVTVSYSNGCYPGYGYGDKNHDHSGPPGRDPDACWPGNGYGDKNHDHSGPPGQTDKPSTSGSPTEHGKSAQAPGHGK